MKTRINQMAGELKCFAVVLAALATLALPAKAATSYSFGSGGNTFSITFNWVNASLEMGLTEILRSDFSSYYYLTTGNVYADNVGRTASETQCRINGIQAVGMINWLNTSVGLPAAYTFSGDGGSLVNWVRNSGAKFFLPTEAEWNLGLTGNNYAPGLCNYEWIQDTDGGGGNIDGVVDGSRDKSWDDGMRATYQDTGFRVSSDPNITIVPEPSTYALFGLGAIGMLMVMRRKKTA